MAPNAFLEPLVVISLLAGGTIINRNTQASISTSLRSSRGSLRDPFDDHLEDGLTRDNSSDTLYKSADDGLISPSLLPDTESRWRKREIGILSWKKRVTSPNTRVYRGTLLSRILHRFPFLVEAWYWALIYWVYQLGRAFTAVRFDQSTVDIARRHAFDIIKVEKALGIFWELQLQAEVLKHPQLLMYTNWVYSYIHIPATILFLVSLYYFTITSSSHGDITLRGDKEHRHSKILQGPPLYEARRRTMAMCNLIAFTIFTTWPCMPPRLLSDPSVPGLEGDQARSYGFIDTVHGASGSGSVWTSNKFCNQWAAMPSLHFGYSLLIGLTLMTLPLASDQAVPRRLPSLRRWLCVACGALYPSIILFAVIATANHFILDVVAGAAVCAAACGGNRVLLNLLPVEDYFLWVLRVYKPDKGVRG